MKLKNPNHWKVSSGLLSGFGILLILLLCVSIVSFLQIYHTDNNVDNLVNVKIPLEETVASLETDVRVLSATILSFPATKASVDIDQLESNFEVSIDRLADNISHTELRDSVETLSTNIDDLITSTRNITLAVDQMDYQHESLAEDITDIYTSIDTNILIQIGVEDPYSFDKTQSAYGMLTNLQSLSFGIQDYSGLPASDLREKVTHIHESFDINLAKYQNTDLSELEESWISKIDDDYNNVVIDIDEFVGSIENLNSILTEYQQIANQILASLDDEIMPALSASTERTFTDSTGSLETTGIWILILGISGLIVGGGIALIVSLKIHKSIGRLRDGALAVANGKIEHRFYTDSKDEFGQIALTFNQILENMGRSREALGESEETAWQLLDSTTDSVFLMDLRGIIMASNEIAATRYEQSLEQMIDASYYDLLPADLMASRKAQVIEVIRTGKPFHFEEDREGMILDTRIFPVINPDTRRVVRIAIFARDITTRKWVEEVTESLGRRNELILESAGEGIYGLDTQGKTTFVNPAAARMLGYRPEDLIGQHHHELVHHSKANGVPYPSHQCPIYASFKDGKIRTNIDSEVFWRKDGTSFSVEYTSTPIVEDGVIMGAVVTFRDITERKHMETALRRREERYRTIFESPPTLILSVDSAGIVIDCNPMRVQKVLGYLPDEIVGQKLMLFVPEDYHNIFLSSLKEVIEKGVDYNNRYKMTRKDGTVIEVNVNYASVKNDIGEYVRTICMIDDITELVQL